MFIVVQDINDPHPCTILDEDAIFQATKRKVFGPDTKESCEAFVLEKCKGTLLPPD